MYGRIYYPEMDHYLPLVPLALRTLANQRSGSEPTGWGFPHRVGWYRPGGPVGLGFPHLAGRCQPGGPPSSSRFVRAVDIWQDSLFGDGTLLSPGGAGVTNPRTPGWCFRTVRGGIGPGSQRVRPGFVEVVDVYKDFRSGNGTLSSPGSPDSTIYNPQVGVSTPCGAVSTRETPDFVPGSSL